MVEKARVKKITKSILSYLKNKGWEDSLPGIVGELTLLVKKSSSVVEVFTPTKLTVGQKGKAQKLAAKLTGLKKVKCVFSLDESLIDGAKFRYKDRIWDLSTSGRLGVLIKKK